MKKLKITQVKTGFNNDGQVCIGLFDDDTLIGDIPLDLDEAKELILHLTHALMSASEIKNALNKRLN